MKNKIKLIALLLSFFLLGAIIFLRGQRAAAEEASVSAPDAVQSPAPIVEEKEEWTPEYRINHLTVAANRSDYPSDESYANFRSIVMGDIAPNILYRSSSPLGGILGYLGGEEGKDRPAVTEGLVEKVGINAVINMAYTEEELRNALAEGGHDADYYRMLYENGRVFSDRLPYDYHDKEFEQGLLTGLILLSENDPPYLLHCHGGVDRTGFAAMILEMLMGADKDEIAADYMESYVNLFRVPRGDEVYSMLWETTAAGKLHAIIQEYGDPSKEENDLRDVAEAYLFSIGMDQETMDRLTGHLRTGQ